MHISELQPTFNPQIHEVSQVRIRVLPGKEGDSEAWNGVDTWIHFVTLVPGTELTCLVQQFESAPGKIMTPTVILQDPPIFCTGQIGVLSGDAGESPLCIFQVIDDGTDICSPPRDVLWILLCRLGRRGLFQGLCLDLPI